MVFDDELLCIFLGGTPIGYLMTNYFEIFGVVGYLTRNYFELFWEEGYLVRNYFEIFWWYMVLDDKLL